MAVLSGDVCLTSVTADDPMNKICSRMNEVKKKRCDLSLIFIRSAFFFSFKFRLLKIEDSISFH